MSSTLNALLGGVLIGVSASILLVFNGRIAGISGILASSLTKEITQNLWKIVFVMGLLVGGYLAHYVLDVPIPTPTHDGVWLAVVAGLLVGVGTRMASGCTSGHGVCGISRLSVRSLVATLSFMFAGFVTVYVMGALS
ncbi:MAG: YeeE/YedE family protein [Pseudomonadota bacterium]